MLLFFLALNSFLGVFVEAGVAFPLRHVAPARLSAASQGRDFGWQLPPGAWPRRRGRSRSTLSLF